MSGMTRARQAVVRIVTDDYLDLYLLAVTAFAFTVLGVLAIANVTELASIILALLAVLALSQIRGRRHLAAIERSQRTDPLAILTDRFPAELADRGTAATSLLLIGTSLSGAAGTWAKNDMRRVLRNGGEARVLLLDPTNKELLSAVSRRDSPELGAERLSKRILASLDELAELRDRTGGRLETRVASFPLAIGVTAVNLGRQEAVIAIQHYEYKPAGEALPIISLRTTDSFWFGHYAAEANKMWEDGSPWPLSTGQLLARSSRPQLLDSFGPGLDQALPQARRLLVTGITRNTFVTSNYAKLEALLQNGCQIRFVLLDPDSAAVGTAANRYYAERSQHRAAERIRGTIRLLSELSHSTGGDITLRLTRQPLAMGIIAIEGLPGDPASSAALFAEYYSYQSATEPKFILQPSDDQWYAYFLTESEALWADAAEFSFASP